jgi:integral membrane protein
MKNAFRIISFLEGLSFILLLFIATPIKYFGENDSYVKLLGMPHGILFIVYVALAIFLKKGLKWRSKTFLFILSASLIPFGTFYMDKKYLRN